MTKSEDSIQEITRTLKQAAAGIDPEKARERAFFMKTAMPLLGLTVPQQRKLIRKGYSFSKTPFKEQFPIWDHVWKEAGIHEVKMQAGFYLDGHWDETPAAALWPLVRDWADSLNCWDQSDTLSGVYAHLFEAEPELIKPTFVAWNTDPNPWLRRQSMVSLLYYTRFRKRLPDRALVFSFAGARLGDEDYYVQKGLGWMVREAFNAWPEETLAFLNDCVGDLSPVAWQAATEKLAPEDKAELKALRKSARKRG